MPAKKIKKQLRKEEAAFIKFWNSCPTKEQFDLGMDRKLLRPFYFYYMVKYPNGGIPRIPREKGVA